jgi:hypothetical protein
MKRSDTQTRIDQNARANNGPLAHLCSLIEGDLKYQAQRSDEDSGADRSDATYGEKPRASCGEALPL